MNKLMNKVILIIDNQSSISQNIAHLAANEGATVLLAYSSNLSSTFVNDSTITDFFKQETHSLLGWRNLMKKITVKYKKIDVLVTMNTQNSPSLFFPFDVPDFNWYLCQQNEIKLLKYISKTVVPLMESNGGGTITHISSLANFEVNNAVLFTPFETPDHFIQKNIRNYTQKKVRINTIYPTVINTPLLEYNLKTRHAKYKRTVPLSYFTSPTDVATAAIYLSCDESSFITGSKLVLNGKNSLLNN